MIIFQICHSDVCRNLFVDIERNGKKYIGSLHHHPIVTISSDLYKADLPRRIGRNIRGIPRAYNVSPLTEFSGDI